MGWKTNPLAAFYASLDVWVIEILRDLEPVLEKLVELNFGPGITFEITHKPLAEQAMEQQSNAVGGMAPQAQQGESSYPGWNPPGQRMGLAIDPVEAVGRGALSASSIVRAARQAMEDAKPIKMGLGDFQHEFSSTQFNLPFELACEMRSMGSRIKIDDLAEDGQELEPHVTVKYGLFTNDAEDVRKIVQGNEPIAIQFGKASFFECAKYDVVKVEVESEGLRELNKLISDALPHHDTHPSYIPHATIAYVKSGLGAKYAAVLNDMEGKTAVFDQLVFSDRNGQQILISMIGKATRFGLSKNG